MKMGLKISIVILAGRDENNLKRLFDSINKLNEKPFEIIVVVDTKFVVDFDKNKFNSYGLEIVFLNYSGSGMQPHMRNLAIKNSKGQFLWFIDDDVSLSVDSYSNLKSVIFNLESKDEIGAIGGQIIEDKDFNVLDLYKPIDFTLFRGFVGNYNFQETDFPYELYDSVYSKLNIKYPVIPFVQGTSMIFDKLKLIEIGGFDEDLGFGYASFEDSDPCLAMHKKGYKTIYCNEVVLEHHKLIRVGGISRGYDNYLYQTSLVRNFIIVVAKNKYPTVITSILYIIFFNFFHYLRMIYYNNDGLKLNVNSFKVVWNSTISIINGYKLALGVLRKNRLRRINTSQF